MWLVSFSAVYGLHGIICSGALPWLSEPDWARRALLTAWAAAVLLQIGALLAVLRPGLGGQPSLVERIGVGLGVVALVAVVWTLFPVAVVPSCAENGWQIR
jgi:hypothetical protein